MYCVLSVGMKNGSPIYPCKLPAYPYHHATNVICSRLQTQTDGGEWKDTLFVLVVWGSCSSCWTHILTITTQNNNKNVSQNIYKRTYTSVSTWLSECLFSTIILSLLLKLSTYIVLCLNNLIKILVFFLFY